MTFNEARRLLDRHFRSHPAMSCESGDVIFFKRTSKRVEAKAIARNVLIFPSLHDSQIFDIRSQYGDRICADDSFWWKSATLFKPF